MPEPATTGELTPAPRKPAQAAGAPPIMLAMGEYATIMLTFGDEFDAQLGPMAAPGAGQVSVSETNIVNATVNFTGPPTPQAIVRIDAVNPGETVVDYRNDAAAVSIPVKVVRRVAQSVSYDANSVSRLPL